MTKDLLIVGAVVALVAIMLLAALPEITSAMPEVYYVEPTEPETAVEAKAETVLQSTASVRYALTAAERWLFEAYPDWDDPQVTYWMPLPERPEGV